MRRLTPLLLPLLLLVVGCGGASPPSPQRVTQPATAPTRTYSQELRVGCRPPVGAGVMGACAPRAKEGIGVAPAGVRRLRIPDVSEYQPAVTGRVSTVIRLYEAGDNQQDAKAAINAYRLLRWGAWFAGYSFLRPGSCTGQAARTVQIIHRIGGLDGPVIADAEVPLPPGFVRCFTSTVHRLAPRYPVGTYTSCGTVSEVALPLWVADYGVPAPCSPSGDPWVAWQYVAGAWCGEQEPTDCSLDNGITRLRPRAPGPSPAVKRRLVRYWRAERARVLRLYHTARCGPSSTGPKCTAWRRRQHTLWLDIRRLEG